MTDYLADADHIADSEVQAKAEGWHHQWTDEYRRAWGYAGKVYAHADAADDANAYSDANAYTHVDAHAEASADADADAHAHAAATAYADADVYADAYADVDAHTHADAHADANTDAHSDTDAPADAYVYADTESYPPTKGIPTMPLRPGLYLFTSPSSDSVAVLRVAWLRPMQGEEHEALNVVTPLRGEYTTMLSEAQDKPPKGWKWTKPLKRPTQYHRAQIRNPISLDPEGYATVCPMPMDWVTL